MSLIKLQNLIDSGEQLNYRSQIAVFKSFDNKRGEWEIMVDINNIPTIFNKKTEEAIDLWLDNFKSANKIDDTPACTPQVITTLQHQTYEPAVYKENKETLVNLSRLLLEDIEKVRANPAYVPQAKQVCNSINTIVSITKLQLQLLNEK